MAGFIPKGGRARSAALVAVLFVAAVLAGVMALRPWADDSRSNPPGEQVAGESVLITWEPMPAPIFTGEEQDNPSAGNWPEIPDEKLEWRLMLAEAGSSPRPIYSTRRQLGLPVWAPSGAQVTVRYASKAVVAPNGPNILAGVITFDARNPARQPAELAAQLVATLSASPDGNKVLLLTRGAPGVAGDLVLVDVHTKAAARLTGLPGRLSPSTQALWSPDGAFLLVFSATSASFGAGPPPGEFFAVPITNGPARRIAAASLFSAAWSPAAPHRLAYIEDGGVLWLFDPANGSKRQVVGPGTFETANAPVWQADAKHIVVGNHRVEVSSGSVATYPLPAGRLAELAISPDGRYMISAESPRIAPEEPHLCPLGGSPQSRLMLYDRSADATEILKDCDGRAFFSLQWLGDSRHIVMSGSDCSYCESPMRNVVLKNVTTGREVALTNGLEFLAWAIPSPDGDRVLVTGDKLRVYSAQGDLLQQIDPPSGFSVTAAAWAPDGKRVVYLLSPTGVWGI